MTFIEPVTLKGEHATLEPLDPKHEAALRAAAADGELSRLWYTSVAPPDKIGDYVARALDMRERLGAMPFAVRCRPCEELREAAERRPMWRSRTRSWRESELVGG